MTGLTTLAAVFDCVLAIKDSALSYGAAALLWRSSSFVANRQSWHAGLVSPKLGGWNKVFRSFFPTAEILVLKVNEVAI